MTLLDKNTPFFLYPSCIKEPFEKKKPIKTIFPKAGIIYDFGPNMPIEYNIEYS